MRFFGRLSRQDFGSTVIAAACQSHAGRSGHTYETRAPRAADQGRTTRHNVRVDLDAVRALWDAEAATFDAEPDHGLLSHDTRLAWWTVLSGLLPPPPARIADLGSGTGSVALLLAEHGYQVSGMDLSPLMVQRATAKAADAGLWVDFTVGDAAEPTLEPGGYDVVFARHVVWALPDPEVALRRWADLLAPAGRLVLIEGRWNTGAGLSAADLHALVSPLTSSIDVTSLPDPTLWGKATHDERYALLARF